MHSRMKRPSAQNLFEANAIFFDDQACLDLSVLETLPEFKYLLQSFAPINNNGRMAQK